jgi:hypothetical protein
MTNWTYFVCEAFPFRQANRLRGFANWLAIETEQLDRYRYPENSASGSTQNGDGTGGSVNVKRVMRGRYLEVR